MEKKVNLKKASSFYFIGTLFNKGIGFLTVPIFTRILTVSDYGVVTTYNSWVSTVSVFMSLALYMAIRASFVDYKEKTQDFTAVILTFTCLYSASLSFLILIAAYIIPFDMGIGLVALCLVQSFSAALIEDVSMYLMMQYRYKARTAIMVLPNLISTIFAIVLIKFVLSGKLYMGRIVPTALITLLFGVIVLIYIFSISKKRFNKEYLSYGLKISIPLVFHGLALGILSHSDRIMITLIRDSSETGIYGLIYNFSMIATVVTTAFDGIWVPFFTRNMNDEEYETINKYSIKYIELITIVIIEVILAAPEVVKLFATEPYWEGISIIPPIVISNLLIFLYTLYVNIEHYHKKTIFIMINTISAALLNILLNWFLIKSYGYVGAAYATVISYIVSLVLHYTYARKLNKFLFHIKQILIPIFSVLIVTILFYIFINQWLVRWTIAIIFAIAIFVKERTFLINMVKKKTI